LHLCKLLALKHFNQAFVRPRVNQSSFFQTQSQTQETSICLSSSMPHLLGDPCCLFTPLS
jgi:hypothetical protein